MRGGVAVVQQGWTPMAARGAGSDLFPEMMRLTLDMLMRTLFSRRLDDEHVDIFETLTVVLRDAERRIWSPFSPPRWLPVRRNREVRDALRTLDSFVFDLIDKRRAERERVQGALESELYAGMVAHRDRKSTRLNSSH